MMRNLLCKRLLLTNHTYGWERNLGKLGEISFRQGYDTSRVRCEG